MAGWIGPVVALSLVVVAFSAAILTYMTFRSLIEVRRAADALSREVGRLRSDIAPALGTIKQLSEKGMEVGALAQEEARELIDMTRRVRYDVERGLRQARIRLAEFDALVGVVQEEVEGAVVDLSSAMETARAGVGVIGQLRRLIRPRRRGAA